MTKFYLDSHPNKSGEYPIRVYNRPSSQQPPLLTTIDFSIAKDKWNPETQLVLEGTKKYPTINSKGITGAEINARIAEVRMAFNKLEAAPGRIDADALKKALMAITGKKGRSASATGEADAHKGPQPQQGEVLAHYDEFLREEGRSQQWAEGTLEHLRACSGHLEAFSKKRYKGRMNFADLNAEGIAAFIDYLRKTAAMAEITAHKHYKNLKWYLNWCIRKGYCTELAISSFKPKFKLVKKPVIFLTHSELLTLYNYEIPGNGTEVSLHRANGEEYKKIVHNASGMAKARDLFCFCAFTSLRYSDMAKLKRADVSKDHITVTTQKTNDRLEIPLAKNAAALLDKYADLPDSRGLALPVISNQQMNVYLKDLCELCGFNELITITDYRKSKREDTTSEKWELIGTHAARRTFICYALTKGIAPQVVMKFTGHSDYKAMKPYIEIAQADAAAAMARLDD